MEIDDQPQQMSDVQESTMYRNRKHVQKRPLGITLLGIFMLAGGMFCICAGLSESPAGILGMVVSGTPAVVIHF
jgi:drug/metabolite transporter (DMT)-like permease